MAATVQYTVRGLSKRFDRAVRRRAKREGKSINQTVVDWLEKLAADEGEKVVGNGLDFIAGTWVEEPAVDEALADQRRIDADIWS